MKVQGHSEQNKLLLSFTDPNWLLYNNGLTRDNALNYFALSPFYDPASNNQAIRTQNVSTIHLLNMTGLEFMIEPNIHEPHLFIIKKQIRRSPSQVDVLEVFYILEGVVYQCPSLLHLLMTRYDKLTEYMKRALHIIIQNTKHSASGGHHCFVEENDSVISDFDIGMYREFPSVNSIVADVETFAKLCEE